MRAFFEMKFYLKQSDNLKRIRAFGIRYSNLTYHKIGIELTLKYLIFWSIDNELLE